MLTALRSFPRPIQLLAVNQFGINVGFYLLVPYLAGHLTDDIGLSAAVVGVVLGVRNLSQQGLFPLGGTAADRFGARTVIIVGCALRVVGFAVFAWGTSLPALLAASVLSGLAGALFNPAVRAYLSRAAPRRRAEAFALFNVFANAGALVGPLLGSALLWVGGFRAAALVAAGVFAALTVAQALALPAQRVTPSGRGVLGDWRSCLGNRRFLTLTAVVSGMFALQSQLYLLLPVQARQATGSAAAVAALFVLATLVGIGAQLPVTRWCRRRLRRADAISWGLGIIGGGFLLPLLSVGAAPARTWAEALTRLLPVLATTLALTVGVLMAQPFILELVPEFAGDRLAGTYFGAFYLASGLVAAVGNAAVGAAVDTAGHDGVPAAAWLLCASLGLASALAVRLLRHRWEPAPAPHTEPSGAAT